MIVIDTSAIIAIAKNEADADACRRAIQMEKDILMSAGTYAEIMIVATVKGIYNDVEDLVHQVVSKVIPLTVARAKFVGEIYSTWGKGIHPAGLNFGDCFAYATAKEFGFPLLYIGHDFSRTDITSAIAVL